MQIGRYHSLQQIGEGGMGVVFLAEQREPVRRKIALKIVKPGMGTKAVLARFEAERDNLAEHYLAASRFDDARPLYERTLEIRKATLPPDHLEVIESMSNLAGFYLRTSQLDKSLKFHEEAFELIRNRLESEILGLDPPNRWKSPEIPGLEADDNRFFYFAVFFGQKTVTFQVACGICR